MKYAIIEISGRQFSVEVGKYYDFNCIQTQFDNEIILNRVMLVNNNGMILIGAPYIKNVTILGKILKHLQDKKKIIYKMRPKKKTRKKSGYRQGLTRIYIKNIIIN